MAKKVPASTTAYLKKYRVIKSAGVVEYGTILFPTFAQLAEDCERDGEVVYTSQLMHDNDLKQRISNYKANQAKTKAKTRAMPASQDTDGKLFVKRYEVRSPCGSRTENIYFSSFDELIADPPRLDETVFLVSFVPKETIADNAAEPANQPLTERQWQEKEFERLKLLLGKE